MPLGPVIAEQALGGDLAFVGHGDLWQELLNQLLLAGPQLVPAGPAVEPVEGGGIAGFLRGHRNQRLERTCEALNRRSCGGALFPPMKRFLAFIAIMVGLAAPAQATGGFVCRTAGARPIQVSIGFGHVAGAPLLQDATRLSDNGRGVSVRAPQWWFDGTELRLLLSDPNGIRREASVKARRNGHVYDGNIWRNGQRRWIRSREG